MGFQLPTSTGFSPDFSHQQYDRHLLRFGNQQWWMQPLPPRYCLWREEWYQLWYVALGAAVFVAWFSEENGGEIGRTWFFAGFLCFFGDLIPFFFFKSLIGFEGATFWNPWKTFPQGKPMTQSRRMDEKESHGRESVVYVGGFNTGFSWWWYIYI